MALGTVSKCFILSGCCFLLIAFSKSCAAQEAAENPTVLLDHLAGDWVLKGTLGGKQSTHDIHADWVLNREYLRLHEVSREKKTSGDPAYEAIVFISWDAKAQEYTCLWLDNTSGGGLSVPTARAKWEEHAIPFVWVLSPSDSLHTTFTYDKGLDRWKLTIDDVKNGKAERFADVTLTRSRRERRDGERRRSASAGAFSLICIPVMQLITDFPFLNRNALVHLKIQDAILALNK